MLENLSFIITDVLPIGAPWGGSEVLSFLSALTSFILYEWQREERLAKFPVYCIHGDGVCRMEECGKCTTTAIQRQHQTYYQYLTVVSGMGAATIHNPDMDIQIEPILHSRLSLYPSQNFLSLLGYTYTRLCPQKMDKAAIYTGIVKHLDKNIPVFLQHKDKCSWYLVTGHDESGRLCGYDGNKNVVFWDDWMDFCGAALLVEKKTDACRSVYTEFQNFRNALLRTVTTAENEKLAAFLQKDELFASLPPAALKKVYDYIAAVTSFYAGSRLCCHHILHNRFLGLYQKPLSFSCLEKAADRFMDIHHTCFWNVFYIMDYKFLTPTHKTLALFQKKSTRHKLAEYLRAIEESDRQAYLLLQGL